MSHMKKIAYEMLSWKWVLFIVIVFIYGSLDRQRIINYSISSQVNFNQWDIMISILSNAIFLLYIFLPIMILFSCLTIKKSWDTSIIIRIGSWRRWVFYTIKSFSSIVFISVFYLVIIAIIFTIGCDFEWGWSSYSSLGDQFNPLVSWVSRQSGYPPYAALITHLIIFVLFLFVLHSVMASLYALIPNLVLLSTIGFFLFFYAIASFRYLNISWLILYNYMTFYSSTMSFHSVFPVLIILISILLLSIYIIPSSKTLKLQSFWKWMMEKYPYMIYLMLILLGIASPSLTSKTNSITVWDNLYLRFYGVSPEGGFSLSLFLFYIITYMGYIYLFQVYISDYLSGRFYYMVIRYGSLQNWYFRFIGQVGLGSILFLFGLIILTILMGGVTGQSLQPEISILTGIPYEQVLYHFLVNGWLQMLNYLLIIFISSWVFKAASYNLTKIGILVVAILPMVNKGGWLPTGLNSMGYLSGQWADILRITSVFVVYLLLESGIILYLFKKKLMSFY
ncbi:hypothetical protein D3C74_214660 [compost metagenome]